MQPTNSGNLDTKSGQKTFSAAAPHPNSRPYRYYREPWTVTFWDQARLFSVQLLCVGGSGAIAKTAVAPLERIKILLQVQHVSSTPAEQRYKGFLDALRRIPQQEGGWKALYRGNGANVARLLPEVTFRFMVYDQFKLMFAPVVGTPGLSDKFAAGAATGVLRSLLFYPLDLCRVRITADMASAGQRHYTGLRQCVAQTLAKEGVFGLYRGMLPSLIGITPYLSLSLTMYDTLKQSVPVDKVSRSQWWYPLLKMGAGSTAAVAAQVAVYPLDTIRRRLQVSGGQGTSIRYRGMVDCVRTMLKQEGIGAFYRGLGTSCLRTMPGAAVQFVAYDFIKTSIAIIDPTTSVNSPL